MSITYNPLLVLLSILVAIQASYVGLRLAIQVPEARGLPRRLLLTGASLSLGLGIWGMHFVGMLAISAPAGIDYQVLPTLLSFLLCVLVVGIAFLGASLWPRTPLTLALTAGVMGIGIATMHYVGMAALNACLQIGYDLGYVLASILAAMAASATALWLATMARRRPPLILCAVLLGIATASMHYIAMAGTRVLPLPHLGSDSTPTLSSGLMAIVVAVVAFIVSAIFLLTLVPESAALAAGTAAPSAAGALPEASPLTASAPPEPDVAALQAPQPASPAALRLPLPVERDGRRILIPPEEIYAVRANAHYSYVFNGEEELFCSLSIGEVAACLGENGFARVHRSHIVNLSRVASVRKTADGGFVDLTGLRPVAVPVSRAKIGALRARFVERSFSVPMSPALHENSA